MPAKRGRPLSSESDNIAVNRRREQVRERVRQHRIRQREEQTQQPVVTSAQYEQGESIINLSSVEEEEAVETSPALGMRKSPDIQIPGDPLDAQLQRRAQDVDEHLSLYRQRRPEGVQLRQHQQHNPTGFFRRFAQPKLQMSEPSNACNSAAPAQPNADIPRLPASHHYSPPLHDDDANLRRGITTGFQAAEDDDEVFGAGDDSPDGARVEQARDVMPIRVDITGLTLGSEDFLGREQLEARSDDEESHISFVSEREVDEEREDALEYTAEKLFAQLQGGHHGCSEEQHTESLRQHIEDAGENHHGLGAIFHDRRLPSALRSEGIMTPAVLEQQRMPTARQWEAMFCGVAVQGGQRLPMNICLHKEETQAVEPRVAFDVDSFLGFWWSLAAAKQGFSYQPAAQATQNIQTDVHLETEVYESPNGEDDTVRACKKMLRDVPHCLLGRVHGASNITVHVLFPHLPMAAWRDRFVSMTEEQLSRWTDRIFLPAIWRVFPPPYTQHLPPTYRVALADSKANQIEARRIETSSYQSQQAITYHLQPEYLQELWQVVLEIIRDTPGLGDFREPQLFFTAKGTKLMFQNRPSEPTLLDVIERFESYLERAIDMRFVEHERFYVDLGKEICAGTSLLPGQHRHFGDEAQVYCWKRCCLEAYMQWMYDGKPPSPRARGQQYYHQNMLYDASSLTSVTLKESKQRKGGLIYSQFYGSVKEMVDASKCKPFDNDALEEMALDPQLRRAARNIAGGHRREVGIVERAYTASKLRARAAILDSKRRSFGIREEHRITWELFQQLKALLEEQDRESLEVVMSDCPSYAWSIRTSVYLDFLWRSADKYATGFEVVHARSRHGMVSWEQTKMMFGFLRCLRYVVGGHRIEPESAMWWSKRSTGEPGQQRSWYGLGFCNTLPRYKYCWWEPRVDWQQVCFKPRVTNCMLFGNGVLRGQVMRRGAQVTAFFDMALALERGLEWLRANRENEEIRERVLSWVVHICLKQFRIDVLGAVKAEIREAHREEALKGERPFSYEYFDEIMREGCYLMSGNRCEFKVPAHLVHFLLDEGDERVRQHWADKPFRKLYQRARIGLGLHQHALKESFTRRYWRWLFDYHWILPYPCGNALLQTSKTGGHRMWYSIEWDEERRAWKWGRKGWQVGQPAQLPRYTGWGEEEWKRWMEERGGAEGESEEE